jgi:hypothetical protein
MLIARGSAVDVFICVCSVLSGQNRAGIWLWWVSSQLTLALNGWKVEALTLTGQKLPGLGSNWPESIGYCDWSEGSRALFSLYPAIVAGAGGRWTLPLNLD